MITTIPFGTRIPNENESTQLKKLGFNLDKMDKEGRYYYLEVPNDPRIQVTRRSISDRKEFTVKFNDEDVIWINQKLAIWDSYVSFGLKENNITKALLKSDNISENQEPSVSRKM